MRAALDTALKVSVDGNDLRKTLREQGYKLDANPAHKYATLRRIGSKKAERFATLTVSLETEQKRLKAAIPEMEAALDSTTDKAADLQRFIERAR